MGMARDRPVPVRWLLGHDPLLNPSNNPVLALAPESETPMSNPDTIHSTTVSHRLVGWGTFEDLTDSILGRIFGHLVVLAQPVVQEYHSDLFVDARWLRENVTGPTTFEYVVRTSGTNIGDTAAYAKTSPGAVHYRLTLRSERPGSYGQSDWWLDITEIGATASTVLTNDEQARMCLPPTIGGIPVQTEGCSCGMADRGAPGHDDH